MKSNQKEFIDYVRNFAETSRNHIWLGGSFLRGNATPFSDVDISAFMGLDALRALIYGYGEPVYLSYTTNPEGIIIVIYEDGVAVDLEVIEKVDLPADGFFHMESIKEREYVRNSGFCKVICQRNDLPYQTARLFHRSLIKFLGEKKEAGVSVANEIAEFLLSEPAVTENDYKNGITRLINEFNDKYPLDEKYRELCLELIGLIGDGNAPMFYNEYEQFYRMTEGSKAFENFCKSAFGEDFSQDGFSDIDQINRILEFIPQGEDVHILDIGCGNGKMLGYLQKKTGAHIHGFDYSLNAIDAARKLFENDAEFRQGLIGEIEYPDEQFDVITSMDSMYFAPDMEKFLAQIMRWLKKDGVLFVCYQEGDVMPKTANSSTTVLAKALESLGLSYNVEDITQETYDLLKKKREIALKFQSEFEAEGNKEWFDLLMIQTDCVTEPYEVFAGKMARYIYTVSK